MRIVPLDRPWKEDQPLLVFDFLISVLNIRKDFKVLSHFIKIWIQPSACLDHGLYRILSSYWLVHFFYLLKRSANGLHYFGLDWIAECWNILLMSRNPKNNNCWLSGMALLEHGSAEKIAVFAYTNRDPNKQEVRFIFEWSGSEIWGIFKNA